MTIDITWDSDPQQWDDAFALIPRSTLLQSRGYGEAICPALGQRARRGAILARGELVGVFQLQEASLFRRAVHALILDRGPLWLPGYEEAALRRGFFQAFAKTYPQRFGRRRRLLPEVQRGSDLAGLPLRRQARQTPYQTIWLNLEPELETIRGKLKGKWRNMLAKAEKSDVHVTWDWAGRGLDRLIEVYARDKAAKGYPGPSAPVLRRLGRNFARRGAAGIATAWHQDRPAARLLVLTHGRAATYQIGVVEEAGRKVAANHLLLWSAIEQLKLRGLASFDLGGINDETAAGVKKFKQGLGGEEITLAGQYS